MVKYGADEEQDHNNQSKSCKYMEFTVDEDFNVPDAKGDIDRFIASKGQITLDETEVLDGRVRISGNVSYAILYQTDADGSTFENHEGEIPFEEVINADGLVPGDKVSVQSSLEDLYVTVINSRKYEVRGLVQVNCGRASRSLRRALLESQMVQVSSV